MAHNYLTWNDWVIIWLMTTLKSCVFYWILWFATCHNITNTNNIFTLSQWSLTFCASSWRLRFISFFMCVKYIPLEYFRRGRNTMYLCRYGFIYILYLLSTAKRQRPSIMFFVAFVYVWCLHVTEILHKRMGWILIKFTESTHWMHMHCRITSVVNTIQDGCHN